MAKEITDKNLIDKALKEINMFYEKNRKKAFTASMGASLSFNLPNNRNQPTHEELWLQSFLKPLKIGLREVTRNIPRGFLVTRPKSDPNSLMLGIVYYDKKDKGDNEDLINVSKLGIAHLKSSEVIKKFPEYKGYHREFKKYFK